jgi:hypothetical protein
MRYVRFSELGIQEETILSEEKPGDDWHEVPENNDGKLYKLVSGKAKAMTETQLNTHRAELEKEATVSFVRRERSRLLMESDWTQLPSSNLSDAKKIEWEAYRQTLRDLPSTVGPDLGYSFPEAPRH